MRLKGIWMLLRIIPLASWSMSSILLGLSVVVYHYGWQAVSFVDLSLIIFSALLLQGIIAHAYNDLKDWDSGTDRLSPGILSGGSGVIVELVLNKGEVRNLAVKGILLTIMIAGYFTLRVGVEVLIFLFVGIWAAVAYSCSPFKLAYRPWFGEWLCAWPAMVVCTVGTSYVLSGGYWFLHSLLLGMLHATFSIVWLMMHHFPDIEADLLAIPPKWTTIAYFKVTRGMKAAVGVVRGYLFLTLLIALVNGYIFKKAEIFGISAFFITAVFYSISQTSFEELRAVTRTEIVTICMTIANALGISFILFILQP